MKLKCVNIATPNPSAMSRFYSLVLGQPCRRRAPNRFEIPAGGAFVVITHSDTKTPVNPDCCGLEFAVDDVDEALVVDADQIPGVEPVAGERFGGRLGRLLGHGGSGDQGECGEADKQGGFVHGVRP